MAQIIVAFIAIFLLSVSAVDLRTYKKNVYLFIN